MSFNSAGWAVLSTLLLGCFVHRIGIAIRNVLFHPLSGFPGPKWLAVSMIPIYFVRLRGFGPQYISMLHEKYGPVVRLGPNELSYVAADAWKDIYGRQPDGRPMLKKDLIQYGPDVSGVPGMIRVLDDEDHARQRRIFSHAFSERALREQEPLIRRYVDLLMSSLMTMCTKQKVDPEDPQSQIDLVKMFNLATFDIMADLTFGEPMGLLEKGDYNVWLNNTFGMVKAISVMHAIRRFPALRYCFEALMPKSLREKRKRHFEFSKQRVDKRIKRDIERPDIWSLALQNEGPERIPLGEMYSNASTFVVAGSETTATLLSGVTYLLCKHPDRLRRLIKEIRQTASPGELNFLNLQKLPYLHACIEEALRIYPPFPVGAMRVTPPGGAVICGEHVPEGVTVSVTQFAAFRSSRNFADALSFEPERWIEGANSKYENDDKSVLQPFSFGPRNCLGKSLAYHEMRITLANLLWHFDVTLQDPSQDWIQEQPIYELWEKTPLYVSLTPVVR